MKTFKTLLGKTLTKIEGKVYDKEIIFTTTDGEKYKLYHEQDCCESVNVEEIAGDLNDLINSPILQADEETSEKEENHGHSTWTFYRISTAKGQVVIRWLGESNGYYSESVEFAQIK